MAICRLFLALFGFALTAQAETLTLSVGGKDTSFTLQSLQKQLPVEKIAIDDPVYKKAKSYDGFDLSKVLALAGLKAGQGGDELVFTALDGYAPTAPYAALEKHKAYVVFQETGGKPGQFEKVAQGKAMVSPAPWYVVWAEGKALAHEVPWPYQLARIELVDFQKKYPKLYPQGVKADTAVGKGFAVFKSQCLKCHSINLEGGDIGPELNAPKNVTEYWNRDTLKAFIRDATSFRYKSKMPPFPMLSEADIDNLLAYLEHMKRSKVKL
ncbi:c-type cytochrome [bacterium]|nr:c-type cytochrome [bacterium]